MNKLEIKMQWQTVTKKGHKIYTEIPVKLSEKIDIVFGSEGAGFPKFVYEKYADKLYRIPMRSDFRSLNLSSSAAIVAYCMDRCSDH